MSMILNIHRQRGYMFSMKCINCKGEWSPPVGITLTECPFCKKPLGPTKTQKTYDSAKDALRFIIQTYGSEALLVKNLFSDIAPNLSDERELIKMFREKGSLDILKDALNASASDQGIALKRAIGKLPSYLQNSPEVVMLMNDFATALGWIVSTPMVTKSISPQLVDMIPLEHRTKMSDSQNSRVSDIAPKIGSTMRFGVYDWRVLDVKNGQALILCDKIIEERRYHSSLTATTWAECELRGYLNSTFYNSFGQDKSRIIEVLNNTPSNLWYDTKGGSATTDKIFLLSLEEVDKYFGNSGDYTNKRRKRLQENILSSTQDHHYMSNDYDQLRIAKDYSGVASWWWLRSSGDRSNRAAIVLNSGNVYVSGYYVSSLYGGIRAALWLNL